MQPLGSTEHSCGFTTKAVTQAAVWAGRALQPVARACCWLSPCACLQPAIISTMPVFGQTSAAAAAAADDVCLQPTRLLAVVIAKNTVGSSWRKTLGTRWVVCGWRRAVLQGRQAATLHRTVGKRDSSQTDKMDCGCVAAYTRQCPEITAGLHSICRQSCACRWPAHAQQRPGLTAQFLQGQ